MSSAVKHSGRDNASSDSEFADVKRVPPQTAASSQLSSMGGSPATTAAGEQTQRGAGVRREQRRPPSGGTKTPTKRPKLEGASSEAEPSPSDTPLSPTPDTPKKRKGNTKKVDALALASPRVGDKTGAKWTPEAELQFCIGYLAFLEPKFSADAAQWMVEYMGRTPRSVRDFHNLKLVPQLRKIREEQAKLRQQGQSSDNKSTLRARTGAP